LIAWGDTIAVDGWKLDAYRKNPVVMWGHDASRTPIGKGRVWREGNALVCAVTFAPSIMGQHVADLVAGGCLKATSVGFRPIKMEPSHDKGRGYGIDFKEQELLEFSLVSVPANAEALIRPKHAEQSRKRENERRKLKLKAIQLRASQ
jgi:HK97 family phage prohead protease